MRSNTDTLKNSFYPLTIYIRLEQSPKPYQHGTNCAPVWRQAPKKTEVPSIHIHSVDTTT